MDEPEMILNHSKVLYFVRFGPHIRLESRRPKQVTQVPSHLVLRCLQGFMKGLLKRNVIGYSGSRLRPKMVFRNQMLTVGSISAVAY